MKIPMHLIATVIAIALGNVSGIGYEVAIFLAGFWTGREITQAEYRWIEQYGSGHRSNMPWYGGVDPKAWNYTSFVVDLILPLAVCSARISAELFRV